MRRLARVVLALTLAGAVAAPAIAQPYPDRAMEAFRDANRLYQNQDYRAAAEKYEEVLANDPNVTQAYFFLGHSYDQQYRPARRGDPANDDLLTKAIENYRKSADVEQDPKVRRLALDYLVSAYGTDKLDDPAEAEPVLLEMLLAYPEDTSIHFALSQLYEQSGDDERAEKMLTEARNAHPSDSAVYMQLAFFYNRQGEFSKAMDALNERAAREPNNPEAHYTVATFYWEKAYRDFSTPQPDKVQYVEQGLEAVDRAIQLNPDYFEALTYKNLLLRVQAALEKDPGRQQALLIDANEWRDRATEVRNRAKAATPQK